MEKWTEHLKEQYKKIEVSSEAKKESRTGSGRQKRNAGRRESYRLGGLPAVPRRPLWR